MKKKIIEKLIYITSSIITLFLVFTFCYIISSITPKETLEIIPENAKYIAKITYIYKGEDTYYLTDYDKYSDCYSFYTCDGNVTYLTTELWDTFEITEIGEKNNE